MPFPVMSKAQPWIGSNIEGNVRSGLRIGGRRDADRAGKCRRKVGKDIGMERFVATMVSSDCGLAASCATVIASTSILSQVTSGNTTAGDLRGDFVP